MAAPDNERTAQNPLSIGLVGHGRRLETLGATIQACPVLKLVAQAGMREAAALPEVPWFDDTRVLLTRPEVQAIVLAGSTRGDIAVAGLAAEHGLPVWRLPPLARNFTEGIEIARRMSKGPTIQRVASWWEHVADHAWHEMAWPEGFEPLYSELRLSAAGPTLEMWQSRVDEAGGGVLPGDAYPLLEALVAARGLPESLTAAIGRYRGDADAPGRETEDTGVAILSYATGGTALVRATWDVPPYEQVLMHHGRAESLRLSDEEVTLLDAEGRVIDGHPLPTDFVGAELLRFVDCVRRDARDRATAPLERHVAVTALLETIYLAARTGHPESPRKFYAAQGWPEPRS